MTENSPTCVHTLGGRIFDLAAPVVADVNYEDIRRTLTQTPRFKPMVHSKILNVWEHTMMCALASPNKRIAQLMAIHDMEEAYMTDIISPVKKAIAAVCRQEEIINPLALISEDVTSTICAAAKIALPNADEEKQMHLIDKQVECWEGTRLGMNTSAFYVPFLDDFVETQFEMLWSGIKHDTNYNRGLEAELMKGLLPELVGDYYDD